MPLPSPGDLPDPGIEPVSLMSPALQEGSLPLAPPKPPLHLGSSVSGCGQKDYKYQINVGEGVRKREAWCSAGGNVHGRRHYGQCGGSSETRNELPQAQQSSPAFMF